MHLSESHPWLEQVTDHFRLIHSMTHPRPISNDFDAMHNLLSSRFVERGQRGVRDDLPSSGSVVAKHLARERNLHCGNARRLAMDQAIL